MDKEALLAEVWKNPRKAFEAVGVNFSRKLKGNEIAFHCPGPAHKNHDEHPSASLNIETGKWYCQVEKTGGDIFEMAGLIFGLGTFPEKLAKVAEMLGVESQNGHESKKKIVKTYPYLDESGTLLYEAVRFKPKSFAQRRPDPEKPGEWIWSLGSTRRVLFRLPDLTGQSTVYLAEGEEDVKRLWDFGIPATCGAMGAGKWRTEYIEQLKNAGAQSAVVLPDNDPPGEKHAVQVANSLFEAGFRVKIVRLPGLKDGGDISDWLDEGNSKNELAEVVQNTPLMLVKQDPPEDDKSGKNTAQKKNGKRKEAPPPEELDGRGLIHPALHLDDRGAVLCRVSPEGACQLVTSSRNTYEPATAKPILRFLPRPFPDLAGRWDEKDFENFLAEGGSHCVSELRVLISRELDLAMELPCKEQRTLISLWVIGTYFHPLFLTFPRLSLTAERGSGKSKLLEILQAISWNGLLMLSPTPAVLFRLVDAYRPTLLLDEMEGLVRQDKAEILSILNAGYKRGGTVPRVERKDTREVRSFSVYSPMALAGIKGLNSVTADRCIAVSLQRGIDRQKINAEIDPTSSSFARIRSGCHRLILTKWAEVKEAYSRVELPEWLTARARELWKPILALAAMADEESGLDLTKDILALAKEHVEDGDGLSAESEALVSELQERLGQAEEFVVRPKELREPLQKLLGWRDPPTPVAVASWLRRLGFPKAKPPKDRDGARYLIKADHLQNVTARYAPPTTVTLSPSQDNSLNNNECDSVTGNVMVGVDVTVNSSQEERKPEIDELFPPQTNEAAPDEADDWEDGF